MRLELPNMVEKAEVEQMNTRFIAGGGSKDRKGKSGQKAKSNVKHSRSRSKGKKKGGGGFGCCRKKQKTPEKGRSKATKKQPKVKVVKPLPPVPNEQLGDIVLVKDKSKIAPVEKKDPQTPEKKGSSTPERSDANVKAIKDQKALPKLDEEEKLKPDSKEGENEKQEKSNLEKKGVGEKKEGGEKKAKEKKEKVKLDKKESDDSSAESKVQKKGETDPPETPEVSESLDKLQNKGKKDEKKGSKEKWMKLAKRIVANDASIAANDFEKVAGYIAPHVSKTQFVANMDKNRFCDVVCLDHSRIKLKDGTYIHANYVNLDKQKNAILTQLPLPNTAADFWQMIIEKRIKCILLILTDREYDTLGGRLVFPPNQDFMCFEERNIRVGEFRQIELSKGWNLKVVSITNGTYKEFVHIHHYKTWPHNGAPTDIKQVWQIQSAIRRYGNTPPVFMSLSGCGRAGTWALFEVAHLSLHSDSPVFEMPKYLERVRSGRLHSVQSLAQYSFVYTLLAEHVLGNGFCRLVKKCVPSEEEERLHAILKQLTIR